MKIFQQMVDFRNEAMHIVRLRGSRPRRPADASSIKSRFSFRDALLQGEGHGRYGHLVAGLRCCWFILPHTLNKFETISSYHCLLIKGSLQEAIQNL
jgi:hypothetical protein